MKRVLFLSLNRKPSSLAVRIGITQNEIEVDDNGEKPTEDDLNVYISLSHIVQIELKESNDQEQNVYVMEENG